MLDRPESSLRLTCACGAVVFCRPDAVAPAHCGFCDAALNQTGGTDGQGGPHAESVVAQATPTPTPVRRRVFVAEIVCLLCGREAGTATAEQWPPTGPILFQPPDAQAPTPVRAWWRLRCPVCGGNTAADEVTTRTVRLEPVIDWREVRPRRGRPPKWLVDQRRLRAVPD